MYNQAQYRAALAEWQRLVDSKPQRPELSRGGADVWLESTNGDIRISTTSICILSADDARALGRFLLDVAGPEDAP